MKIPKYLFVALAILLLLPIAAAHETADEKPKTTPDKPFYGISVAIDKLSLALTSDKHAKAKKGLTIAHERLLEIKAMREAGKLDKAQKSADNYAQTMDVVAAAVEQATTDAPEKEAEAVAETEAGLAEIEEEASDATNALTSDTEVDELTQKQKEAIEKINSKISHHKKAIEKLEARKTKLLEKIPKEKLDEIERRHEKLAEREARAQQEITEAEQAIVAATPLAANLPQGNRFLANANKHLQMAKDTLVANKVGEAFGHANAARHIANAIVKKAEQLEKREQKKEGADILLDKEKREQPGEPLRGIAVDEAKTLRPNKSEDSVKGNKGAGPEDTNAPEQKQEQRSSSGY